LAVDLVSHIRAKLRRIFEPMKEEIRGSWRKLHLDGLCKLYSLPYSVRMNESKQAKCHVSAKRSAYKVLVRKPDRRDYLEEKLELGRIILKNRIGGCGLHSSGYGQIPVAGFYVHSNEPLDVIKCWKVLD
jgi:hypothetical protein